MLESEYKPKLIATLEKRFPGIIILKNDSSLRQGIPDLVLLYRDTWAMLEVKRSSKASKRPNQEYYIAMAQDMSFAAFISPENEREVLDALQQSFESRR
jgi:hypothetical protein